MFLAWLRLLPLYNCFHHHHRHSSIRGACVAIKYHLMLFTNKTQSGLSVQFIDNLYIIILITHRNSASIVPSSCSLLLLLFCVFIHLFSTLYTYERINDKRSTWSGLRLMDEISTFSINLLVHAQTAPSRPKRD